MPIPVNTRISPSLHPDNVTSLDGYEELQGFGLAQTVNAFKTAYEALDAMWSAKDAVSKNTSWTEDRRIVELSKLGERKWDTIAKAFDDSRANLLKQIESYENELTAPVVSKAASSVSAEIRKHVKDMSLSERVAFVQQAMQDGDTVTLSALLGAPSYLSGMTNDAQKVYVRQYRERMEPEKAKRMKLAQAAADLLMERGALIAKELEKAVGASPQKAAVLRQRHEVATKALA
jgi:hypothetical protein